VIRVPALAALALTMRPVRAAVEHDALSPAGPQAAHIYDVSIIITAVCALVFVAIMVALALRAIPPRPIGIISVNDAAGSVTRDYARFAICFCTNMGTGFAALPERVPIITRDEVAWSSTSPK